MCFQKRARSFGSEELGGDVALSTLQATASMGCAVFYQFHSTALGSMVSICEINSLENLKRRALDRLKSFLAHGQTVTSSGIAWSKSLLGVSSL